MCGLFGLINYNTSDVMNLNEIIKSLAVECAERGTDATGVAYANNNKLYICKRAVAAYKMKFDLPCNTKCIIGHTRHATQGNKKYLPNNHPFPGKVKNVSFALAHNGVLCNDITLREKYTLPKTKIETDSYIAVQLLEYKNKLDFDSLKFMSEKICGSFSFAIMDNKNNTYLVKGDSPLSIIHFPELKLYVYASTDNILWRAIIVCPLFNQMKNRAFETIDINSGDILKIDNKGNLLYDKFNHLESYIQKYDWRSYGCWDYGIEYEQEYIEELKNIAGTYGYTDEQIDILYEEGFTPEEIEEFLYGKEFVIDKK